MALSAENVSGDGGESDDSCVFLSFVRPSNRNQIFETIVISSDDDEEPGENGDTIVDNIEQMLPTETDDEQHQLKLTWNSSIYCAESDGLDDDENSTSRNQRNGKYFEIKKTLLR